MGNKEVEYICKECERIVNEKDDINLKIPKDSRIKKEIDEIKELEAAMVIQDGDFVFENTNQLFYHILDSEKRVRGEKGCEDYRRGIGTNGISGIFYKGNVYNVEKVKDLFYSRDKKIEFEYLRHKRGVRVVGDLKKIGIENIRPLTLKFPGDEDYYSPPVVEVDYEEVEKFMNRIKRKFK